MAILVYGQSVEFPRIDEALKRSTASGLAARIDDVLGRELVAPSGLTYAEGGTFGVQGPATQAGLALVLEIEKR